LGAEVFAIPADRTEHLLWRLQHGEIDGIAPKAVVVMIGTNNLKSGPIRQPPEQVAQGVAAVVAEIRSRLADSNVLLLGILPRQPQYDWFPAVRRETNRLLAALAESDEKVRFLDFGEKLLGEDGLPSRRFFGGDLLHPTAAGYRVRAEETAPTVCDSMGLPSTGKEPKP
jgi:beta-glucosidase